ncbi:uncharacterized protein A1O9_06920 [Exophiala aquamarina CBS 119918]|uniref:Ketoreductase domain-containing protein n=1 Tax=Exophiala aquamarina CBS 119918 TaxID=1182545 RepID=A0A072PMI4_9EURO|nr:uncharacterized protein A1O9_06920 [Exophiala aquamarina CBS 119918]KEF56730.1 hypothetical protein A1O9_06920 [Exophiala aquamarina CBS 119918]
MSYSDLKGKVFIVTGAAAGMGRDISLRLARQGAAVGLIDLRSPDETLADIEKHGGQALKFSCDVKDSKALDDIIRQVAEKFGRLDGAANMAGYVGTHSLETMTSDQWENMIGVNLTGVKNSIASELRYMKGSGSIVNASSLSGTQGHANHAAYCSSKWGVIGLSKVAAQEVGARGIRVNAVAPGFVHTALTASIMPKEQLEKTFNSHIALGRMAEPEDITRVILFLLSDEARYISSAVIHVDGGYQ